MNYLVQAFDARHNWLDTSGGKGYATEIEGARDMLTFVAGVKTGLLRDVDAETHTTKRIAYWVVSVDGIRREVYTTSWGRHCNVKIRDFGPGCHPPAPVPST